MKKLSKEELKALENEWTDCRALEKLVEHYWRMVYHTVREAFVRYNAPFTKQDIEDMRNEVFAELLDRECRKLRLYREDGGRSFKNWIKLIASRTVGMYVRKKDRPGVFGGDYLMPLDEMTKVPELRDEIRRLEARQSLHRALDCMEKLPHKECLVLKFLFSDGLSVPEIASKMQEEENNIYQIRHKGVKHLKDLLRQIEGEQR